MHKPEVCAVLAAIGTSLFAALTVVAMQFSGVLRWMFSDGVSTGELLFVAIFAAIVAGISGYLNAQKITNSKRV